MAALTLPSLMKSSSARHILREARFLCSASPALVTETKCPRFRTLENNPVNHTENHIGKYYTMPPEVKEKLFLAGGINKEFANLLPAFNELSIMVRSPVVEIINYIRQMNFDCPTLRILIYGAYGCGKTVSLIHLAHFSYESKFIMLHIPWVSLWTKSPRETTDSIFKPGRIDLPVESALWLQHFKSQNNELMEKLDLKTTQTYTWSQRETTEIGQPLMDVVNHGVARGIHASDCAAVLLKELKSQSKSGKYKVMLLVDGINAFYNKTDVRRPDGTLVPSEDITICRAFLKAFWNDWNNSVVIGALDTIPKDRDKCNSIPFTPRYLLGKEGFELLDPFIPVHIGNYTEKEAESVLDYYIDRKWIQDESARSEKGRTHLKFLTTNHPLTLLKITYSL